MSYAYANLTQPKNTSPGIAEYIYLAPVNDFEQDGIKCPVAPFQNPGDEVKVLENHSFKDGKKFAKVALAPNKNSLNAKTIGDLMFQKLDFELKVFIPGSYAEVHEAVANWINTPLVVLAKDSDCPANMYYQIGCDCTSAYFMADFETSTTNGAAKGYTATIKWQNASVLLYAGQIEAYSN